MTDLPAAVRQLQEPETLARFFHETYEKLAPEFGYETRPESAVPWEEVPQQNRHLMIAVAAVVLNDLVGPLIADWERLRYEIEETIHDLAVPSTHTAKGAASRLSAALALPGGETEE